MTGYVPAVLITTVDEVFIFFILYLIVLMIGYVISVIVVQRIESKIPSAPTTDIGKYYVALKRVILVISK